jgi:hypothetical protein
MVGVKLMMSFTVVKRKGQTIAVLYQRRRATSDGEKAYVVHEANLGDKMSQGNSALGAIVAPKAMIFSSNRLSTTIRYGWNVRVRRKVNDYRIKQRINSVDRNVRAPFCPLDEVDHQQRELELGTQGPRHVRVCNVCK